MMEDRILDETILTLIFGRPFGQWLTVPSLQRLTGLRCKDMLSTRPQHLSSFSKADNNKNLLKPRYFVTYLVVVEL